ncbi:ParB/RepB/Spo0J family partition protein [Campylobacter jejuni]|uniref:Chromosome partitioning protein, ParB family n=3 Tax=Campylobacter jejuni TaxID=197 RepID=A0A2R4D2I1_CAMJU|nr:MULTISPECIES: ParB/RepB/Spo0J family partition protein [Campylobacter]EAJ6189822.1 ParB/RepB/Spo0J family partition protein [Campylobacter fetus]EDK21586.1 parB family protein [Campylobacter jejuni subsp. jejuni CG8486]KDA37557.1 chromosome partitioning protein ParB [Campylobacter jejuni K5]MCG4118982.1 ParB/RepB/Spo0J family partition protein [Campylobacter coli]WPM68581.1 ParB/RepB/Spo0J family partition protein [Campylobacter sp. CFSAN122748]WPM70271.1 ParB/RepB/Spo0J family partition p
MGLNKDRGLSSLISDMDTVYSKELGFDKNQSTMIEIDQISPNPFQPRKNFDQEALDELANSIKEFGLIQPIIVFKKNNKFILIAGERRLRAVKALGKKEILAFIADIDENKLRELALIENIQRENLNPIELANSYKDLMQVHKITQENLAELIHKSRTQITNTLRLLNLDIRTQELIASGKISQGHAKVLVGLDQKDEKMLVDSIIGQKLNVRDTEKIVKKIKNNESLPNQEFEDEIKKLKQILNRFGFDCKNKNNDFVIHLENIDKIKKLIKMLEKF